MVSTRTFDACTMADFAAARLSVPRDTRITLQPSAAKISAAARPIPFELPVISAVLPAIFKSMISPSDERPNYETARMPQQRDRTHGSRPVRSRGGRFLSRMDNIWRIAAHQERRYEPD